MLSASGGGSSVVSTAGAGGAHPGTSTPTGGAYSPAGGAISTLGGATNAGGASAATSASGGTTPLGGITGGAAGVGGASHFASGGAALGGASVVSTPTTGSIPAITSSAQGGTSVVLTSAPTGGMAMTGGAGSVASPTGGAPPSGGTTSVATTAEIGGTQALGGTSATGDSSSDPCASQPCKNGGSCTPSGNSYSCGCVGGYFGPQCETAHFEWLGVNGAFARGISANGKVIVGSILAASGKDVPAKWTKETGFIALESKSDVIDQGYALAASADGSVIGGQVSLGSSGGAFRWNADDGIISLGLDNGSVASGVTSSGNAIVGNMAGKESSPLCHAFRWTPAGGVVDVVALGSVCSVVGVSADGTVIGGNYEPNLGDSIAAPFIWNLSNGILKIATDCTLGSCLASALSYDGSTVVGYKNHQAFRFITNVGFKYLNPGDQTNSEPTAVSSDGTIVVGYGSAKGWIWDATNGMRAFENILTGFGVDLSEWHTDSTSLLIRAMSSDGKVVAGTGWRNYKATSWVARL